MKINDKIIIDIATVVERIQFVIPWNTNGEDNILLSNHPLNLHPDLNWTLLNALNDFEQIQNDCRTSKPFSTNTIKRLKAASVIIKMALADFTAFVIKYDSPDQRLKKEFQKK